MAITNNLKITVDSRSARCVHTWVVVGSLAQWPEHLHLKWGVLDLIPSGFPGFFSLPAGLLMLMG